MKNTGKLCLISAYSDTVRKNIFIISYFRMNCKKNCAQSQKTFYRNRMAQKKAFRSTGQKDPVTPNAIVLIMIRYFNYRLSTFSGNIS